MYSRSYNVPSHPANAGKTRWPQKKFRNTFIGRCLFAASLLVSTQAAVIANAEAGSYSLFESGQVRPLAMSPNGKQLFALNTPDNRLEIFNISKDGLTPAGSVVVGMERACVVWPTMARCTGVVTRLTVVQAAITSSLTPASITSMSPLPSSMRRS